EDGIRDFHVTGVQTCALPISVELLAGLGVLKSNTFRADGVYGALTLGDGQALLHAARKRAGVFVQGVAKADLLEQFGGLFAGLRSEERRVGKAGGTGGWPTCE